MRMEWLCLLRQMRGHHLRVRRRLSGLLLLLLLGCLFGPLLFLRFELHMLQRLLVHVRLLGIGLRLHGRSQGCVCRWSEVLRLELQRSG